MTEPGSAPRAEAEIMAGWPASEAPLVSIVCITYNHQEYLRETIEGFLLQETDFPFEIIIHDDASTDSTADLIDEYAERYPRLIKKIAQQKNQFSIGVKTLYLAIEQARGKYVAFCEGDDYWISPQKLQSQVSFLKRNPEYVLCYHDARVIDASGEHLADSVIEFRNLEAIDVDREDLPVCTAHIPALTMCFRNVIDEFPIEYFRCFNGDRFLFALLAEHGSAKYLDLGPAAAYRVHSAGIWSSMNPAQRDLGHAATYACLARYFDGRGDAGAADHYKLLATSSIVNHIKLRHLLWHGLLFMLRRLILRPAASVFRALPKLPK